MENRNNLPVTASESHFAFGSALCAGVVASIVFQALEILLIPLNGGGSPWGPTRMIAAMVLGRGVLPPPATFDWGIAIVALVVDVVLAMIYSVALCWLTKPWRLGRSAVVAAIFGVALYFVNFYWLTAIFPWFTMGRNGVTQLTHVVFSLTAVLAYYWLAHRSPKVQAA
jgi:hypothetical protein